MGYGVSIFVASELHWHSSDHFNFRECVLGNILLRRQSHVAGTVHTIDTAFCLFFLGYQHLYLQSLNGRLVTSSLLTLVLL